MLQLEKNVKRLQRERDGFKQKNTGLENSFDQSKIETDTLQEELHKTQDNLSLLTKNHTILEKDKKELVE